MKMEIDELVLSCTICAGETGDARRYTGKNILFTKLLLKQFVSSNEKKHFYPLKKIFDFCSSCTKILEDLLDLQTELESIQNRLKTKKTEIKIRILQNRQPRKYNGVFETFRKISTRDFRPRVQMWKNNRIYRNKSSELHTGQTTINTSKDTTLVLPCSPEIEGHLPSRKRSLPQTPSPSTAKNNSIFTDDKIKSEIVSILPEESWSLFDGETVIKFEPWKEQIELDEMDNFEMETVEYNDCNSTIIEETQSSNSYAALTIEEYNEQSTSMNPTNGISFPDGKNPPGDNIGPLHKPPFTYLDLVLLAIVTSEKMQLRVQFICDFIEDNFPFYKLTMESSWKEGVKIIVQNRSFFTASHNSVNKTDASNFICGIKNYNMMAGTRKRIHDTLEESATFMAYPERIPIFQEALLRESPTISEPVNNYIVHHVPAPPLSFAVPMSNTNELMRNDENTKLWDKPPLSIAQLSVLAIVTSPSMNVDLKDVLIFIVTNFPYYEDFRNWNNNTLKCHLGLFSFVHVREYGNHGQLLCTIVRNDEYYNTLKLLSNILMSPGISGHLTFPGILVPLKDSVLREVRYMEVVLRYPSTICSCLKYWCGISGS